MTSYRADKPNFLEFWVKMAKMTLKVKVNDPYFQHNLIASHDACLVQIWWFQLKSGTNVDLSSKVFCGIHLRAISCVACDQRVTLLQFQPHLPGASKLSHSPVMCSVPKPLYLSLMPVTRVSKKLNGWAAATTSAGEPQLSSDFFARLGDGSGSLNSSEIIDK